ncbi:MAG: hypothetical protein L0227_02570 [Chloroflexi bacterium]|nr:hypothetical protein [Chloroflexota bacterium]
MKRLAITGLWLYAFWYLGSMIAALMGVPDLLGPALGIAAGIIVGVDPRRLIWARPGLALSTSTAPSGAAAPNAA